MDMWKHGTQSVEKIIIFEATKEIIILYAQDINL